ncbi:MAG TPA: DNA repair protein RadC [Candidatus Sabulitectum sp.]|nr:DNA repair protein RadC [Candidatus Sabulitectum sp.]
MEGHRKRLRERYLRAGARGFTQREALELLLTYALPRRDTRELSQKLLDTYGSLKNVLRQSPASLQSVDGMGETAAVLLSLASQLPVMAEEPGNRLKISGPEQVADYLRKRLGGLRRERFCALLLDSSNELIAEVDLEFGMVNRTQVYPRNLVEKIIAHSATGVILVHNHPGGRLEPSREDIALTRKLTALGKEMDFRVLDHFIVTESDVRAIGNCEG